MPGISNSDLLDLQRTTLENLPKLDFETALSRQKWLAIDLWFKKDKIQVDSGTSISRRVILDTSGNARHVRLYQRSTLNVSDQVKSITAPWVQVEGHYLIERREALRNRTPARYVDLLKVRRQDAMLSMAELLEERAWKTPQNASDDLNPRGLPYHLSKLIPPGGLGYNANIDKPGDFSGRRVIFGDGTTTLTDKAGLDPTAQARWRNYADIKTGMNGDTIKKLARAFHATRFESPMLVSDLKTGSASNYRIYMTLDELVEYEDLARKANDNLGADLAKFHGITTFNRVPIHWTPELNNDTSKPIYGVNHKHFFPIVQEGDWMRENDPIIHPDMHNTFVTFVDGSYQYFCNNVREAGFVIHNALAS